jgi:hypothetical protein
MTWVKFTGRNYQTPNYHATCYLFYVPHMGGGGRGGGSQEESSVRTVSQYIISLSTLTFNLHSIELEYSGDRTTLV